MQLGAMSSDKAKDEYAALVEKLLGGPLNSASDNDTSIAAPLVKTLEDVAYPQRIRDSIKQFQSNCISADISSDGIVNVSLNRQNKGNSFNVEMWIDFKRVFDAINRDENTKVVILTGGSKIFSTGMDLGVFAAMQKLAAAETCEGRKREALSNIIQFLQDSISSTEQCKVPVISAISGHCTGGAVDLITACDLRYCTEDAIFCIKETDLAMVADIGTLQRLPNLIGDMQTRELAFTGRNLHGREAERLGLVLKCFSTHEEMMTEVASVAQKISKKSPLSIRGVKKTVIYSRDHTLGDSLNQVKMWNAAHLYSDDLMQAMQSVLEKTAPTFIKK